MGEVADVEEEDEGVGGGKLVEILCLGIEVDDLGRSCMWDVMSAITELSMGAEWLMQDHRSGGVH